MFSILYLLHTNVLFLIPPYSLLHKSRAQSKLALKITKVIINTSNCTILNVFLHLSKFQLLWNNTEQGRCLVLSGSLAISATCSSSNKKFQNSMKLVTNEKKTIKITNTDQSHQQKWQDYFSQNKAKVIRHYNCKNWTQTRLIVGFRIRLKLLDGNVCSYRESMFIKRCYNA